MHDPIKAQEEKLDGYIIKFLNLNAHNERVLKEARDNYDAMLDKHLNQVEQKIMENLHEMKKLAVKDERKSDKKNHEMDKYVQFIHQ